MKLVSLTKIKVQQQKTQVEMFGRSMYIQRTEIETETPFSFVGMRDIKMVLILGNTWSD
jgi:hypothetical protein